MKNQYKLLSDYLSENFGVAHKDFEKLNVCDNFVQDDSQVYFDIEKMKNSTTKIGKLCWNAFFRNYELENKDLFKEARVFKLGSSIRGIDGRGLRKKGKENLIEALREYEFGTGQYWGCFRFSSNLIPEVGEDGVNDYISNAIKQEIMLFSQEKTLYLKLPYYENEDGFKLHPILIKGKVVPILFIPKDIVSEGRLVLDYESVISQIDNNNEIKSKFIKEKTNWKSKLKEIDFTIIKPKENYSINNVNLYKVCRPYFNTYLNNLFNALTVNDLSSFNNLIKDYLILVHKLVLKRIKNKRKLISVNLYKRSIYFLFNELENIYREKINLVIKEKELILILNNEKYKIKVQLFSRSNENLSSESGITNVYILIKDKYSQQKKTFKTNENVNLCIVDIDTNLNNK